MIIQKTLLKKNTILVNSGCYNKAPLTSWFTSNRNLFLTVLQAGSPRSRNQYDHALMSDLLSSTEGHLLALSVVRCLGFLGYILYLRESESEVAQSCPTLCDPVDCSLLDSSVHGILQARILEWVAISFSRGSSQPRDRTRVSCIAGRRFGKTAVID